MPISIKAEIWQKGTHNPHKGYFGAPGSGDKKCYIPQDTYYIKPLFQDRSYLPNIQREVNKMKTSNLTEFKTLVIKKCSMH